MNHSCYLLIACALLLGILGCADEEIGPVKYATGSTTTVSARALDGEALKNTFYSTHFSPMQDSPAVKKFVAANPDAIGYVEKSAADGSVKLSMDAKKQDLANAPAFKSLRDVEQERKRNEAQNQPPMQQRKKAAVSAQVKKGLAKAFEKFDAYQLAKYDRDGAVRLRDVLDLAGVKAGAVQVRFGALDQPVVAGAPDFEKALDIDHARDGEVMIAFGMNGEQLPLLNGFPCRLIVPGWYSTYWVKMLNAIEVLPGPDDQYWMAKAYKIPATPGANVAPGAKDFPTVPINRMIPRSWMTSLPDGQAIAYEASIPVGGIAMGGDCGVAKVDVSSDGGRTWYRTTLGADEGRYSFRRWDGRVPLRRGPNPIMVRCWNTNGVAQPMKPIWNPGGFMRGNIETTTIIAA